MSYGLDAFQTPDPMYPQAQQQFTPFMPDMGGFSQSNPVLASVTQMGLQMLTSGTGQAWLGTNDRNLFDRMEHDRVTRQHQALVRQAAKLDAPSIHAISRGLTETAGGTFGPDQLAASNQLARGWGTAAPILTQMAPMQVDAAFGQRGSGAVMAEFASMALRQRADPITGATGMSAASSSAFIDAMFKQGWAGDNYRDRSLSAGQAGMLMKELQPMGRLPSSTNIYELQQKDPAAFRRIVEGAGLGNVGDPQQLANINMSGLSPEQRDKVMSSPSTQRELAQFDAKRTVNTLNEWGKAVNAMKDIFGDAGMPDAPMSVLLQSLRTLTSGGMSQMKPGEMSTMVRTMNNLMKGSGIGLEGASMLIQGAQQQGAGLGIETVFATQAAMGGLAFAQAYGQSGRGEYSVWGQVEVSQLAKASTALRQSAVASPMANQIATAMRLQATTPGEFGAGTEAAAYLDAVKKGQTDYTFGGQERSVNMTPAEFTSMMASSSGGRHAEGDIVQEMRNEHSNREYLFRNPSAMRAVERMQGIEYTEKEVVPTVVSVTGTRLSNKFGREFGAVQQAMAGAAAEAIMGVDKELRGQGNEVKRNEALGAQGRVELERIATQQGQAGDEARWILANTTDEQLNTMMGDIAGAQYAAVDSEIYRSSRGQQSLTMRQDLHDPKTQALKARADFRAQTQAAYQEALSTVARDGPLRSFVEELMTPGGERDILGLATAAWAGPKGRKIHEALQSEKGKEQVTSLQAAEKKYRDAEMNFQDVTARQKIGKATDEEVDAASEAWTEANQGRSDVIYKFNTYLRDSGINTDLYNAPKSVQGARASTAAMRDSLSQGKELTRDDMELHKETINAFIKDSREDPMLPMQLGKKGQEKVKELEAIQAKLDAGEGDRADLLQQQDVLLQDVQKRLDKDREAQKEGGIKEIRFGKLVLNDDGSGVILPSDGGEDSEGV